MRSLYFLGLAYLGIAVYALWREPGARPVAAVAVMPANPSPVPGSDARVWFARAKPSCNTLEVEMFMRREPPPATLEGTGFGAACWALAGRIADARSAIAGLPGDDRWKAAGIVFEVGHPIADMGDDRSAGPIMGLVVEFWPNHYMALYHAGAARFALGEYAEAEHHLTEFLKHYRENDGWTGSARGMLSKIAGQ